MPDDNGDWKSIELTVAGMGHVSDALDLGNALVGVSGIAALHMDPLAHTIRVEYDPRFGGPNAITEAIAGAGYAVQQPEETKE